MSQIPVNDINKVRFFTALASLLISVFCFYTDDIINSDGILYLDMARAYIEGGLAATKELFNWPFFSIVIAYIHQVTSLSFEVSASIINTSLFVLLTDALVLLSSKLVINKRQLAIAALFIICFYTLNEYRDFVIRDVGYWAFCSLALYRFILFIEQSTFKNAVIWLTAAVIATLFRVEGIVILFGLPLYLVISQHSSPTFKQSIRLSSVLISTIIIVGVFAENQSTLISAFTKLQTISDYISADKLLSVFNRNTEVIKTGVLNKYSAEYSSLILISGLLVMLSYKLIKALSFGYIALYLLSRWQQKDNSLTFPYRQFLLYFTLLNIVILIVFMFKEYFVVTRYAVMTLLGLLLLLLPTICHSLEQAWLTKNRKLLTFAGLILLVGLIDGTTQSNSKAYIKDTAIWASKNLPESSIILTDDKFIHYYFNLAKSKGLLCAGKIHTDNKFVRQHRRTARLHKGPCSMIKGKNYRNYDYLIIVEKQRNTAFKDFLKNMDIEQIYHLENKRKDGASVYKIIH